MEIHILQGCACVCVSIYIYIEDFTGLVYSTSLWSWYWLIWYIFLLLLILLSTDLSQSTVKAAGYHGGDSVDRSLGNVQGRVWEREEFAWGVFGYKGSRRFEIEDHWTCILADACYFIYLLQHLDLSLFINSNSIFSQNILVVSRYYSRITLKRLADLLCLTLEVCLFPFTFLLLSNVQ